MVSFEHDKSWQKQIAHARSFHIGRWALFFFRRATTVDTLTTSPLGLVVMDALGLGTVMTDVAGWKQT